MITRTIRDIEYHLLPGRPRKTTDIVIERNGIVTVRPPLNYTPEQVDAVVESKLCHFYYRDHRNAFWNEVDKVMPDYHERKEWLRKHGASLVV